MSRERSPVESLFARAGIKPIEKIECDAHGPLVLGNAHGGMPNELGNVPLEVDRDFGTEDLTRLAAHVQEGEAFLIFRESDLGVSPPPAAIRSRALAHVAIVIRNRRVIFIDHPLGEWRDMRPLLVAKRQHIETVVFGSTEAVDTLFSS